MRGLPGEPWIWHIVDFHAYGAGQTSKRASHSRFFAVLVGSNFPAGQFFDSVRHNRMAFPGRVDGILSSVLGAPAAQEETLGGKGAEHGPPPAQLSTGPQYSSPVTTVT